MVKKFFLIIILIVLVLSLVPKEVFCNDHHPVAHHHCSLTCHTCSNMIVPDRISFQEVFQISNFQTPHDFSYQSPTITQLKRPPISLS